ncbi:hypothetical protein [Pseudobacteriovorax antillogorgiicola]|uniref:Tetratricopeptide repeat-containing protein n=1 Tax=Pseudobacteriovorax antillogorgiicola TaxID=1513793 RepID=A0A1Y6CHG8_9BACT|nr:hypothetical protein [Pseudobacteriovorax antillogorgiicola]TCS46954.1 hypothetical protein EDD56_12249 [Pseudobacteriovorax antillogorgiicola]SMF64533.1 hypothetical protein SAMN06296036_12249 [Pseudobacteriovorax antillogorgiicola]
MRFIFYLILLLCQNSQGSEAFEQYKPDMKALNSSPKAKRYYELLNKSVITYKDRPIYEERYKIIKELLVKYPKWIDGHWVFGSEAFQLGSTYVDEKDHDLALKIFSEGEDATRSCLVLEPRNPLCKMFLATNIAAAAAIRGVIPSLRYGSTVLNLWLDVKKSKVNYQFTPEVSLQGSVHYALGLFHRLVPDSTLLDWVFDVRGDIDEAVNLHKKVLSLDGPSPCGNLMLAAALLCKGEKEGSTPTLDVDRLLNKAQSLATKDLNQAICRIGAKTLAETPRLACGYTTAKQQDLKQDPGS